MLKQIWQAITRSAPEGRSIEDLLQVTEQRTYRSDSKFGSKPASTPSREEAMRYVAFGRAIDLMSTQMADLVDSSLHIVDRATGDIVKSRYAKNLTDLILHSPDGFHSGHEFMREVIADYLIDGNGLVMFEEEMSLTGGRRVTSLQRLEAEGARIKVGDQTEGPRAWLYDAVPFGYQHADTYPARRVVHARFMSRGSAGTYNRNGAGFFSPSCLSKLARAIRIGLMGDAWVDAFFDDAAKSSMIIRIPENASPDQIEEIVRAYAKYVADGRAPLVLSGGADARLINPNPQEADTLNLREFSVQEIGRYYGLVAPLIGVHVTQWGSGIEQLARLHSRFCLRPQLTKVLSAFSMRLLPIGQKFDVDFTQELRGDTAAMTALMAAMRPSTNNPGLASREELRALYGFRGDYEDDYGDWNKTEEAPAAGGGQIGGNMPESMPPEDEGGSPHG